MKIGGEVPYLYLEILPTLQPGVLVHVHDIHMPEEYPREKVLNRYFWNEQYLVQGLLIGSTLFQVVWGQRFCELNFPDEYRQTFAGRTSFVENNGSYSLWIRRVHSASR